jgi:hypothetical protein
MRTSRLLLLLLPLGAAAACSNDVSTDTLGDPASRIQAPNGAINGSVTYQGPHPCSANGHIIGNAIVLLFDRRNPPPPAGLAVTAVNFAVVEGDTLFANEPRWGGPNTYCPVEHGITDTITVSSPFSVGPLAGASYLLQSFYDYTGNFLPNFKFRELPEKGDVAGGDVDTNDAQKAINQNPNYTPIYYPVDIGIPEPLPKGAAPGTIPIFDLPAQGFVANNVQVTIGDQFETTRPYFFAEGMNAVVSMGSVVSTEVQSSATYWSTTIGKTGIANSAEFGSGGDPVHYAPVLTIPQDIQTFAPPINAFSAGEPGANLFEVGGTDALKYTGMGLPHLRLRYEGSDSRQAAQAAAAPFNMQLAPFDGTASGGGFRMWQGEWLNPAGKLPDGSTGPIWQAQYIPDSVYKQAGGVPVPFFWPLVILSKLIDDPGHTNDPASLTAQGDANTPVVIMQGITLWGGNDKGISGAGGVYADSLFNTVATTNPILNPSNQYLYISQDGTPTVFNEDHITALLRPAVICFDTLFDANNSDKHGNIVTPVLYGDSADNPPVPNTPIVPLDLLDNNDPARFQANTLVEPPPGWKPGTPPAIPGCLPKGRYAINVVYPDGQAWTVPNEAGACTGTATGEGSTQWNANPPTCSLQPRTVIQSQGPRAVVEIVGPSNPANCKEGAPVPPTPAICLPKKSQ